MARFPVYQVAIVTLLVGLLINHPAVVLGNELLSSDDKTTIDNSGSASSASSSLPKIIPPEVVVDAKNKVDFEFDLDDDRTLLDTFGEAAKQYLTQKVIPKTDPECKWDWRYVRCEPFCHCEFQLKRGDYHLGRSCRQREKLFDCDPITSVPAANSFQLVIQRIVQGSQKLVHAVGNRAKDGYQKVQTNVCDKLPELQCSQEGRLPELAWQERLLCRHKIPNCSSSDQEKEQDGTSTFADMLVNAAQGKSNVAESS